MEVGASRMRVRPPFAIKKKKNNDPIHHTHILSHLRGHGHQCQGIRHGREAQAHLPDIYFSIEEVDGIGVLYTKTGEYSAVLKMENPVQKYSANIEAYYEFTTSSPPLPRPWAKAMRCTSRTCL